MRRIRSRIRLLLPIATASLGLLAVPACRVSPGTEAPALSPDEGEHHPTVGQSAPDFIGEVPGGGWLRFSALRGKPVVLLIFRPRAPYSRELVEALGRLRHEPVLSSTAFVGIAVDSLESVQRFDKMTGGVLPTVRDPSSIAGNYAVVESAAVVLVDTRGIVRFRMDGFAGPRFAQRLSAVADAIRRLPELGNMPARKIRLKYTRYPRTPVFTARDMDGHPVSLAALRGQVVALTFFDQDSPGCRQDLPRLVPVLKELRPRGVRAIGVTSRDGGDLRRFLKEQGIDYPVVVDADRALFARFESRTTPDLLIIDRSGFIRFREEGERPDRAELTRLQLRLVLGDKTPSALAAELPKGLYLGDGQCAACHERERLAWLWTPHSVAWDSLQAGDRRKDPECVSCHATGAGRAGGFSGADATPHLTQVQCESCHGMGGGHPDGIRADRAALSSVCATCHAGKFALTGPLDEALSLVAHQDRPDLGRLFHYSDEQRRRIDQLNERRLETFKPGVGHVGAEVCRDCHRKEYDQWSRTPHAAAFARLLRDGRGGDPSCTPCHTTGFGLKSGFGATITSAMLTGVQCEVCHGPCEDHVGAPAASRKETIYGVTRGCTSCLLQELCTACHDPRNDPDFELEPALARIRH